VTEHVATGPTDAPDRALVASAISKRFGGLRALDDVSMSVRPGEIVGLIGPNGSGKTTLLNIVSGVLAPDAGDVRVDGREVTSWPAHRIARLGIARTFQNIRLFKALTVLENVEVGAAIGSRGTLLRQRARQELAGVRLDMSADREASTLPYGAQRRLEIARAMAAGPRYLMLDEPAAGMNEAESDDLLDTIRAIRDRTGIGLLVIDHDLRLIMRLCDRVIALNQGKQIGEGTPKEVQTNPAVIEAYLGKKRTTKERQRPLAGNGGMQ
jgi:branched-chain amino acid transport system permease protein